MYFQCAVQYCAVSCFDSLTPLATKDTNTPLTHFFNHIGQIFYLCNMQECCSYLPLLQWCCLCNAYINSLPQWSIYTLVLDYTLVSGYTRCQCVKSMYLFLTIKTITQYVVAVLSQFKTLKYKVGFVLWDNTAKIAGNSAVMNYCGNTMYHIANRWCYVILNLKT